MRFRSLTDRARYMEKTIDSVRAMGRRKRPRQGRGAQDSHQGSRHITMERDENGYILPEAMHNETFERYYKAQHILASDEEWKEFTETLRRPLPVSFRVNGRGAFASALRDMIQNELFRQLEDTVGSSSEAGEKGIVVEGEVLKPPEPIAWYPDNLAWQMHYSRNQLRKLPALENVHNFLKVANDFGSITRQETVSMIPPLFLDIRSDHSVLDFCAAPGSKTFQILELLHGQEDTSRQKPSGLVVANDSQFDRCNLLVHQVKRASSSSLIVTNHDAQHFPSVRPRPKTRRFMFDRVLADVPCSGDGTIRKAPDIVPKWNPESGLSLHSLQIKILMRGLQLLKPGGKLVYSTCSFNPVENEAVVAAAVQMCQGCVKVHDASGEVPNLKRRPGLRTWHVMDEKGNWCSPEDAEDTTTKLYRSMFPPEDDEGMHLDRCMRILPHDADSGGFFVAVIEKLSTLPQTIDVNAINRKKWKPWKKQKVQAVDQKEGKEESGEQAGEAVGQEETGKQAQNHSTTALDQSEEEEEEEGPASESDQPNPEVAEGHGTNESKQETQNDDVPPAVKFGPDDGLGPSLEELRSYDLSTRACGNYQNKKVGKFKGKVVDPIYVVNEQNVHDELRQFYGLRKSLELKDHLITRRQVEGTRPKRLYYISDGTRDLLQWDQKEKLRATTAGMKFCERQENKDPTARCSFRITQEAVNQFRDQITKQKATITQEELRRLLHYRNLQFDSEWKPKAFEEPATIESLQKCSTGCVILTPDLQGKSIPGIVDSAELSIVGWKGNHSVGLLVSKAESKHMLERLGGSDDLPPVEELSTGKAGVQKDDEQELES